MSIIHNFNKSELKCLTVFEIFKSFAPDSKIQKFCFDFCKNIFFDSKKRFSNRRRDDKMFSKGSDGGGVGQCAQAAGT